MVQNYIISPDGTRKKEILLKRQVAEKQAEALPLLLASLGDAYISVTVDIGTVIVNAS